MLVVLLFVRAIPNKLQVSHELQSQIPDLALGAFPTNFRGLPDHVDAFDVAATVLTATPHASDATSRRDPTFPTLRTLGVITARRLHARR
jgi:hypothetical protein